MRLMPMLWLCSTWSALTSALYGIIGVGRKQDRPADHVQPGVHASTKDDKMRHCIYCDIDKSEDEFSDEHIWPDALGGDFLPKDVWRSDDVCRSCNSMSGLFVDGSFIRSFIGQSELSSGSLEYLAGKKAVTAISLDYLGPIGDVPTPSGCIAEYWAGPCGANIIHIRPDDGDEQWVSYAGGSPKAKKSKAGRAYMALASDVEFWIFVALESFRQHFDRAERFVVNADVPNHWPFKVPDRLDLIQAEDMKTVDAVLDKGRTGGSLRVQPTFSLTAGHRMLAKVALGVGYKLFGGAYLETPYAKTLRRGMREANADKRKQLLVPGFGIMSGHSLGGTEQILRWPGGWVLLLKVLENKLALTVISPAGRTMGVMVSDDQNLIAQLDQKYVDGLLWITVLVAKQAVGPIALPEYLGHQTGVASVAALTSLASSRGDLSSLPQCCTTVSGSKANDAKDVPPAV
jgi:HNH endonuclease